MSRDIYASLSGAAASWAQMEVVANNIANASTTGYKAGRLAFSLDGSGTSRLSRVYAQATEVHPDLADGALVRDDNPTHLALQGRGFFALEGQERLLLTRDGRFSLDEDGQLVSAAGHPVLGEGGPIEIPPGETIRVSTDGRVYGSESGELDRLRLLAGPVSPVGDNLWEQAGPLEEAEAQVSQGALEASNVDPMRAMVELIEASRYFEAYQKAMRASDEADARVNRTGGR